MHHVRSKIGRLAIAYVVLLSIGANPVARADQTLAGSSVFIDPGHSGKSDASITRQVPNGREGTKDCQTTGTSTTDGYSEHSFNWDVAIRVRDALENLGVRTQMSRTSDSEIGPCIDERAAAANAMQPSAIVSVHADGGPGWGSGFHVNYSSPPLNDAQKGPSIEFAKTMRDSLQADGFRASNYLGANGLFARSDLAGLNLYAFPGILVEMGNMRNADDAARMESPEGRASYAKALVDGIVAYLKQRPSP